MSAQHASRLDHPAVFPAFNRDAAALARARRAREAFQARLVESFDNFLRGSGKDPSDSDLRTFALLAAAEHQLEQRVLGTSPNRVDGQMHDENVLLPSRAYQ
jgi:hypothetical protein